MLNIITSYPKSGNTWLRFIIFGILFNFEDKNFNSKMIEKFVPDLHKIVRNNKLYLDENLKNKKIFLKTHYDYYKIKNLSINKVIVIIRNPLDVLASIINYYDINKEDLDNTVNTFAKYHTLEIFKKFNFPGFSEHIKSWENSNKDLLIVSYSNLLNHFEKTIKEIGVFLNEDIDEKKIKLIQEKTHFNSLLKLEQSERKNNINGFFTTSISNKNNFMNNGSNKNYQKIFNSNQIQKLEDSFFEIIQKYDLGL